MNIDPPLAPRSVRLFRSFVIAVILIAFGAAMGFCDQPEGVNVNWQQALPIKQPVKRQGWMSSWAATTEAAKAGDKPIMLVFTGSDWCQWCQKLEQEVLQTEQFARWSDQVVKFEVDFPTTYQLPPRAAAQNTILAEWYSDFVTTYPTVLFVEPDGRVIGTLGYVEGGPEAWIDRAEGVLATVGDLQASLGANLLIR